MKTKIKFLVFPVVMLFFAVSSYGQTSATATAVATIYTPLSIALTGTNMSFGIIVPTAAAGSVILAPDGGTTLSNVTLVPSGTVTAAQFTVSGNASTTYTIDLPVSVTLTNGAVNMTVDTFTTDALGSLSGAGTEALNVGATLGVGANQAPGNYTGPAFTVTVNYN